MTAAVAGALAANGHRVIRAQPGSFCPPQLCIDGDAFRRTPLCIFVYQIYLQQQHEPMYKHTL